MKEILNWISFKKVIIGLIVFLLLLLLIYFIYTYNIIEESKVVDGDKTEQFVLKETEIDTINDIYHFQGGEAYHILLGEKKGEKAFIFVSLTDSLSKEKITIISADSLKTQEQIEKAWQNECKSCNLIRSSPAMIKNTPLWELTYIDSSERYVIEYVSLEDGTIFEQLKLYRKYSEKG